jgi:ankyrin repeat protein
MNRELHIACIGGDLNKVKELLKHCKMEDVIIQDGMDYTLLHWACCYRNIKIIKELVKHITTKYIDMCGINDGTPLLVSCMWDNIEAIKILILNGASIVDVPKYNTYMRSIKWSKYEHKNVMHPRTRMNIMLCFMVCKMNMEKLK